MTASSNPILPSDDPAEFDAFAEGYDETLNRALSVSGEDKNYFARNRINWLGRWLSRCEVRPNRVLDYGCGTGTAIPLLCDSLGAKQVIGVDVSSASLDVARRSNRSRTASFSSVSDFVPPGDIDVGYCNGVFHHIPVADRQNAAFTVFQSLRPGGVFAFWENNPWNPGARYCMRVNPFDRDAVPLTPSESRHMLRSVGFDILTTNFLFIFPRSLSWFRWLELPLHRMPCGAQFLVLCQRP